METLPTYAPYKLLKMEVLLKRYSIKWVRGLRYSRPKQQPHATVKSWVYEQDENGQPVFDKQGNRKGHWNTHPCDCKACTQAQKYIARVISRETFITRAMPPATQDDLNALPESVAKQRRKEPMPAWMLAQLGKKNALPEHVVRRRLLGKTLNRYLSGR